MNKRINNNSYGIIIDKNEILVELANINNPFIDGLIEEFKARFPNECNVISQSNSTVTFADIASVSETATKAIIKGFVLRFNNDIDAFKVKPKVALSTEAISAINQSKNKSQPDYDKANSIYDNLGMISNLAYVLILLVMAFAGFTMNFPLVGIAILTLFSAWVGFGVAKSTALTAKYTIMSYSRGEK